MNGEIWVRKATREDAAVVLKLITELADYEKLSGDVTATEERLSAALFGEQPQAEVLLGLWQNEPAGFAVYFYQFSTFKAAPVMYLEDLFVKPEFRGRGIGQALFEKIREIAQAKGCCRMQWSVLDWNQPAIRFYERIGARRSTQWMRFELELPRK